MSQRRVLQSLLKSADKNILSDETLVLADALEDIGYMAISHALKKLALDIQAFQELVPEVFQGQKLHPNERLQVNPAITARARRLEKSLRGDAPEGWASGRRVHDEMGRHERTWSFLKKMISSVIEVMDQASKVGWWIRPTRGHPRGMAWPVIFLRWADDKGRQAIVKPLLGEERGKQVVVPSEAFHPFDPRKGPSGTYAMAPGSRAFLPPFVQGTRITSSLQYLREGPRGARRR